MNKVKSSTHLHYLPVVYVLLYPVYLLLEHVLPNVSQELPLELAVIHAVLFLQIPEGSEQHFNFRGLDWLLPLILSVLLLLAVLLLQLVLLHPQVLLSTFSQLEQILFLSPAASACIHRLQGSSLTYILGVSACYVGLYDTAPESLPAVPHSFVLREEKARIFQVLQIFKAVY